MKFLTILAAIFYGGTVYVAADYYIEYRAPPVVPNLRGQREMTVFLYSCKGVPAGISALSAAGSRCALVTSHDQMLRIYFECTFYSVYRPNPQGHQINLIDRGIMPNTEWYLGYSNDAIDHPNFAEPPPEAIAYFRTRLQILATQTVIPSYLVNGNAIYFAKTNLISFFNDFGQANSLFNGFVTFLRRVTDKHHEVAVELVSRRELRTQVDIAMKLALTKMIDPCSVLHGNLLQFASQYCAAYCNFLYVVARHFGSVLPVCSVLKGGYCEGVVCTCTRRNNVFSGCETSPMQVCHNSLRSALHQ